MGDGLLAEFASVVDAVACAVAKSGMAGATPPPRPHTPHRGAHRWQSGDLIVETDDAGAADMQASSSRTVCRPWPSPGASAFRRQSSITSYKVAVGFEFVGEQRVKNIAEPVRIYRVLTEARPQVA
jgi:hypothetical protein